jgi:hypothetical protein
MPINGAGGVQGGSAGAAAGAAGAASPWLQALFTLMGIGLSANGGDIPKNPMQPEMNALLREQLGRLRAQNPLYSDALGMARGMLPTRYRGAGPAIGGGPGASQPGDPGTDGRQPGPTAEPTGRIPTWRL